jgi:shikimate 5-dehydrogenase
VIGNPAAHSRSPLIHNPIFRERGVNAAYSVIETDDFRDVAERMARGDEFVPQGLSITAPFKEEAYRFAIDRGATLTPAAQRAKAINTLLRLPDTSLQAANTDVDGFAKVIGAQAASLQARRLPAAALVIGAGGTARAALTALEQLGIPAIVSNRTTTTGEALAGEFNARFCELSGIASLNADLVIDTLPASADFELPNSLVYSATLITADYSAERPHTARHHIDGRALLEAQAMAQSEIFIQACNEARAYSPSPGMAKPRKTKSSRRKKGDGQ